MPRLQILAVILCVCGIPAVAAAQRGSFGGGGGGLGSSGGFGSSLGSVGSGSTNAGTMGMGSSGSMFGAGGGMFGSSGGLGGGMGSGSGGQGATAGIQSGLNLGVGGVQIGQNAFVGRTNQNGGFVGDRRIGSGMLSSQFGGQRGRGGFGSRGGSGNNWNSRGNAGQGDEGQLSIRPTLKVGFDVETNGSSVARPEFASKFAQMVERAPELAGITYDVDDNGRVILRGIVPDEQAQGLAKILFQLRPGVREVVDEMTVAGAPVE